MILAAALSISCNKEQYVEDIASSDWLWVSAGHTPGAENQTMMLVKFSGAEATLQTLNLGKDYSSFSEGKEYSASVTYKNSGSKGQITVDGDPSMSFEYSFTNNANKMFLRNASSSFMLAHYDISRDELISSLKASIPASLQAMEGFVGPSEYVALNAAIPLQEGALEAGPAVPVPESIWSWIAKGLVTGSASTVAKLIIEGLIADEEATTLDDILDQVNLVNAQLAELINLVHNTTYEHYLNERTNSYLNPMRNLSNEYILRVKEAWQNDPDSVGPIVIEWANRTVGGNPAYVEVRNFIDYIKGTVVERKNIYQMYDMYVYNTHPWENMGYALRENLRAGDLAVIAQSLFLTRLYYSYGDFTEATRDRMCQDLKSSFESFQEFYEANKVERHDGQAICQIKGAHFAMPATLVKRDFYNHPWMPYETPWDFENQESAWWLVHGDTRYTCAQIYRFCMTEDEAKAVAGYYKGSPYTNMVDVLTKDALCTLPFSESEMAGKKIMMQLQTDGSDPHQKDSNYYINARLAMEASKDFNIGEKTIGIAWLERHGFLWMEQWFKQWDTYYNDQLWFRTEITGRY